MKARKLFMTLILLLSGLAVADAREDKSITMEQLPQKAQTFLSVYFTDLKVSYAKMDSELFGKSYEVFLINGSKIEFDSKGEWTEIKCKYDKVPFGALPEGISAFIREKHPENHVVEIERDKKGYDVKLNNGLEIKFDRRSGFVRYDD